jgi:succinate dehydrogenase flavin-adding protein (antitoxin of CptAB toxin-antitoxin module)
VLFEAFLEKQAKQLSEGTWPELEELLTLEDDVLFDWISGRDLPSDPAVLKLLDLLKKC